MSQGILSFINTTKTYFQAFDKDGNGYVSVADIRRMMCGLGEKMEEKDIEFLLEDLAGNDGMVKYADFITKLCSSEEDWGSSQ